MKIKPNNRSGLLLMELLTAILFFSVASAICLQLFVKSHMFSKRSEELDMAVNRTSSAAELILQTSGDMSEFEKYYPSLLTEEGHYLIYYTDSFGICQRKSDAAYELKIQPSSIDAGTSGYELTIRNLISSESVYHLNITVYRQNTHSERRPS